MVVGFVQLLEKRLAGKLDAETREFIDYAVDGATRMQGLIEDILACSRVTTQAQPFASVDSGEALQEALNRLAIRIVETGAEAMQFLRRQGRYGDAPRPDLIRLDLNLPKKDGRAVLAEIKTDPDLKRIPVVVLTTSRAEEDVLTAYDPHANAYVTKSVGPGAVHENRGADRRILDQRGDPAGEMNP